MSAVEACDVITVRTGTVRPFPRGFGRESVELSTRARKRKCDYSKLKWPERYAKEKDKIKRDHRIRYWQNRDEVLAKLRKKRRGPEGEKMREYYKAWCERNKEKLAGYAAKRKEKGRR